MMTCVRLVQLPRQAILPLSAVVCFLGVACGGSEIPEEGPVTRKKFRSLLPDVVCDRVLECDCSFDKRGGTDRKHCRTSVDQYLEGLFLSDDERTEFDGELAGDCLRAAEAADCTNADWVPLCDRVFRPAVEIGATCASDLHCVGFWEEAAHCDETDTCKSGPRQYRGELGDGCTFTQAPGARRTGTEDPQGYASCHLSDGLRCEDVCEPVAEEGEACETVFDCALGTYCDGGICVPTLELGEDCVPVINFACGFTGYCNEDSLCAEQKPAGAQCSEGIECQSSDCSLFGTCSAPGEETVCEHFSSIEMGD